MDLETESGFTDSIEWFLDHLRVERGASSHTLEAYAGDLAAASAFFASLGRADWNGVDADSIDRFQVALSRDKTPATVRRRISAIRSLLKFLKRNGSPVAAELPSVSGLRLPKRLPKALTRDQMEAVLAAPDLSKPEGVRDRALMEVLYGAGLRVSEAVGLRFEELELDSAAMRVTGKRGKTRWIPLPSLTVPWIERYLEEARPALSKKPVAEVFLNDHGRPLSRQSAYHILARCSRRAGIERGVSPHTLRHTYAVHLLQGGADLRGVQELLGHASVSTTQVYTQLDLDEVSRKYRSAHPRR